MKPISTNKFNPSNISRRFQLGPDLVFITNVSWFRIIRELRIALGTTSMMTKVPSTEPEHSHSSLCNYSEANLNLLMQSRRIWCGQEPGPTFTPLDRESLQEARLGLAGLPVLSQAGVRSPPQWLRPLQGAVSLLPTSDCDMRPQQIFLYFYIHRFIWVFARPWAQDS